MKRRAERPAGVPAPVEDGRISLALRRAETAALCRGCVKCCTYITVEIDAPRTPWEYDQWIWALHHRGVQLYVERPERWSLHFETRCAQLGADGRCAIHGRHPVMCREYDPRTCERWLPLADIRAWFDDAAGFERWIRAERPGHWARLVAWRKARVRGAGGRRAHRTAVIPARGPASTPRSG
jgi:Fe-S-cluster containining protein